MNNMIKSQENVFWKRQEVETGSGRGLKKLRLSYIYNYA